MTYDLTQDKPFRTKGYRESILPCNYFPTAKNCTHAIFRTKLLCYNKTTVKKKCESLHNAN